MISDPELRGKVVLLDWAEQDLIEAIGADLELGTHEGNNAASEKFTKDFPRTIEAMKALHARVEALTAELSAGGPDDE